MKRGPAPGRSARHMSSTLDDLELLDSELLNTPAPNATTANFLSQGEKQPAEGAAQHSDVFTNDVVG